MTWDFTHFFVDTSKCRFTLNMWAQYAFFFLTWFSFPDATVPSTRYPRSSNPQLFNPLPETSKIGSGPTLEYTISASSSGWYIKKVIKVLSGAEAWGKKNHLIKVLAKRRGGCLWAYKRFNFLSYNKKIHVWLKHTLAQSSYSILLTILGGECYYFIL